MLLVHAAFYWLPIVCGNVLLSQFAWKLVFAMVSLLSIHWSFFEVWNTIVFVLQLSNLSTY